MKDGQTFIIKYTKLDGEVVERNASNAWHHYEPCKKAPATLCSYNIP